MNEFQLKDLLKLKDSGEGDVVYFRLSSDEKLSVYPKSINRIGNGVAFLARAGMEKKLYLASYDNDDSLLSPFPAEMLQTVRLDGQTRSASCSLNHESAEAVQRVFGFTHPVLLGTENSFGFGDRLGLANPGHVRAVSGKSLKPVFPQQSIRELERTGRTPQDVMDAAVWAVFQEGYHDGFGADADHLKTTADIDRMARAGFTMFTIDPGDYVVEYAERLTAAELRERAGALSWDVLEDTLDDCRKRYEGRVHRISDDFSIEAGPDEVLPALVKYGGVIAHTVTLYRHLETTCTESPFEVELSVDETDSPTTPFEHYFIARELKRLGIRPVSLAPRFIGDFEKGVDYRGDLDRFREEYHKHVRIAEALGPYKISLHSGSDKFSVYEIIGQFPAGRFHVKTAGTSYLVALETIAAKHPALFREILAFSRERYESDRKSYHVSADLAKVPPAESLQDEALAGLFVSDDARQVLHVTFGSVLTARSGDGWLFKDRILAFLRENEDIHYEFLIRHFHRHLDPLLTGKRNHRRD